jgi:ribosomal protein S6
MTYEAEGAANKELDRVAGLSAEILRRVITIKA